VYESFIKQYKKTNEKVGKNQFVVPYLMSSHPGSTIKEAVELAEYLRDLGYMPEQVQDFYPTPSTISTCMYYTGLDPRNLQPVYVPKTPHEKAMQRALIQYRNPKNYELVEKALIMAGRTDLIGFDKKCLIRPRNKYNSYSSEDRRKKEMDGKSSASRNAGGKHPSAKASSTKYSDKKHKDNEHPGAKQWEKKQSDRSQPDKNQFDKKRTDNNQYGTKSLGTKQLGRKAADTKKTNQSTGKNAKSGQSGSKSFNHSKPAGSKRTSSRGR